jgi:hypothetical protein
MHEHGIYWGAPDLGNVLVSRRRGWSDQVFIIDLEKSVRFPRDIRGTRMAYFDLVNLVQSTRLKASGARVRSCLERYGLTANETPRVLAAANAYQSTKFRRYRRRAEFLARGVVTRALSPASGHLHHRATPPD